MPDRLPRRRKRLLAVGVLVAAALIADTVAWASACRRLDDGGGEPARQAGWIVDHAASRWGGWPVAAEVTWPNAILHDDRTGAAMTALPVVWTVASLRLRLAAVAPTQLVMAATGAQTLAIGTAPPVPFTAAKLTATIDLAQRVPPRADAESLAVDAPGFPVRIATVALALPPGGWSADLAGIAVPGHDGHPISPAIDTLRLDGHLTRPIEPMPTSAESARDWRAHGGQLLLDLHALQWGALAASARATVSLDPALQPRADGTVTATGLPATPSQLAAAGIITPASATAAAALLAILTAPAGGGPVTLPLLWQDGVLSIARFPLVRTAPLGWD